MELQQIQPIYDSKKVKRRLSLKPGTESTDSDDIHTMDSLEDKLLEFPKIAMSGQLFLKHTKRKSRKPQYRIVKVNFDQEFNAKEVCWGSGSRRIPVSEIRYISWGHWTPVFDGQRDQLQSELCFSVVGKMQILDLETQTKEMAELWVKGLRMLIGHSDQVSDRMAKDALKKWNFPRSAGRDRRSERMKVDPKKKALDLLQQVR